MPSKNKSLRAIKIFVWKYFQHHDRSIFLAKKFCSRQKKNVRKLHHPWIEHGAQRVCFRFNHESFWQRWILPLNQWCSKYVLWLVVSTRGSLIESRQRYTRATDRRVVACGPVDGEWKDWRPSVMTSVGLSTKRGSCVHLHKACSKWLANDWQKLTDNIWSAHCTGDCEWYVVPIERKLIAGELHCWVALVSKWKWVLNALMRVGWWVQFV